MTTQALHQGSKDWHDDRRKGIGGSDAAAALGMSKFKTPYQLYLEKIGEAEPEDESWEMLRGKCMEPALRQHYANETGRSVLTRKNAIVSEKYPFMRYNADGVTEDGRLAEFKTAAYGKEWGEVGTDEIPQEYLLQVQHGMIVLDLKIADCSVSIAGNKPKYFVVEYDKELAEMLIEGEAKFWENVQLRSAPAPTSNDDVAKMYNQVNGQSIVATAEIMEALNRLRVVRENIKQQECDKEDFEVIIKSFMGEYEVLVAEDRFTPLCTWKQQKGARRIDADALRTNYPDVAASVTTVGAPVRKLLLK